MRDCRVDLCYIKRAASRRWPPLVPAGGAGAPSSALPAVWRFGRVVEVTACSTNLKCLRSAQLVELSADRDTTGLSPHQAGSVCAGGGCVPCAYVVRGAAVSSSR